MIKTIETDKNQETRAFLRMLLVMVLLLIFLNAAALTSMKLCGQKGTAFLAADSDTDNPVYLPSIQATKAHQT